eukprot:15104639-Alexandrium_andersonii.AAC.1
MGSSGLRGPRGPVQATDMSGDGPILSLPDPEPPSLSPHPSTAMFPPPGARRAWHTSSLAH